MERIQLLKRPCVSVSVILILLFVATCGRAPSQYHQPDWNQIDKILADIVPPTFPEKKFDVTRYGAIGDGKTNCTEAFNQAIADCHAAGGGWVVVSAGTYLTGAIHLKSNINLHLKEGAIIRFSTNPRDYLPPVFTRWEGVECMNYSPLIYAYKQRNIAITGSGILDGQADNENWWPWKGRKNYGWQHGQPNQNAGRDSLFRMADNHVPVAKRVLGQGSYLRPQFIQPYKCENVLIEGVKITNSPMWEIHPVLCENVTVREVTVISHGPNNDGCDPESCRNVLIDNCYFDTGDDCIAIKSGRNTDGRRVNMPCENIIIRGCEMKDGHGGVVIGSEISGSVRNVFAENCVMDSPNLERALRIKTNSVRGGIVENIYMRNVTIGEVADAVLRINLNYEEGDVGEFTPIIRNIRMQNVTSKRSKYAVRIEGYRRSPIRDIILDGCRFENVARRNILKHVKNMQTEQVHINGELIGK